MDPQRSAYTDRDVLDSPELEAVAKQYVHAYTGSFQFLLDCADRLRDGYGLTTTQVRTVLNAMRADPRVRVLPVPTAPARPTTVVIYDDSDDDARYLRPVRVRPPYIELPARWHHDFGISTHRRAEVIHKMVHFKCSVTYYPHATQHRFHDRFRVRIAWACGAGLPGVQNRNSSQYTEEWPIRLLTTDEATELLETNARRMCPTCAQHNT